MTPYAKGKIPVLFIHGLWASPLSWHQMIATLEEDPATECGTSSGPSGIRRATRSRTRPSFCGRIWQEFLAEA